MGARLVVTLGRGLTRLEITRLHAPDLSILKSGRAWKGCGELWRAPALQALHQQCLLLPRCRDEGTEALRRPLFSVED